MTEIAPRAAVLLALALAAAAGAQTDVYITEYGFNNSQVSAVNTDGDNLRTLFPLPADLPAGTYSLLVGLYDADTNIRLLTADGQDAYTVLNDLTLP